MPTSTTTICSPPRSVRSFGGRRDLSRRNGLPDHSTRANSQTGPALLSSKRIRGFTLLEVLVVMTILAILTGTVMLSFTGADAEQSLKGAAERLAMRVELARQRALTRNREWGIYVETGSYAFAEFDPEQGLWVRQEGRPFTQNDVPETVELNLTLADFDEGSFLENKETDSEDLPQILVFSSGEITPFTIQLEPAWDTLPWLVVSDGLSRAEASREDGS